MERVALDSTTVLSVGYDPALQLLEVEFRGGRVYEYYEVPAGVVQWLQRTPKKAAFIRRMIEPNYAYRALAAQVPGKYTGQTQPPGGLEPQGPAADTHAATRRDNFIEEDLAGALLRSLEALASDCP